MFATSSELFERSIPAIRSALFSFSARAAAIYGFTIFGINPCFALNNDMTINHEVVEKYLKKSSRNQSFLSRWIILKGISTA